jgi:hypothetical protein
MVEEMVKEIQADDQFHQEAHFAETRCRYDSH